MWKLSLPVLYYLHTRCVNGYESVTIPTDIYEKLNRRSDDVQDSFHIHNTWLARISDIEISNQAIYQILLFHNFRNHCILFGDIGIYKTFESNYHTEVNFCIRDIRCNKLRF
jgi:hypothetical protein